MSWKTVLAFKDTTLEWAKSYLQNCKCKVNIRNKYSIPRDQDFSVLQGTVENEIWPEINLHRYADGLGIEG